MEMDKSETCQGLDMDPYWETEADAKKVGIRMWSLGDKYVSPRNWRRLQRKK